MRKKDYEKEQRVKEAVIKLILEEGFEGASIAKIAREAGVSPATVYIYYDSKEQMLASIYREYAGDTYDYLMGRVRADMDGRELVSSLIRGYYDYITQNTQIFRFVEQCSHCPTLSCEAYDDPCRAFEFLDRMKEQGLLRRYSNESLAAILFSPVKAISQDFPAADSRADQLLEELIQIVQDALLLL
ncbi:MAG: TetR/AcrR family transcriptional regulator [Oscillospiraceae bacterium]|nr:TetR/AcrR family transcriptional regulator [Oscillospiraceae bacterium]